MTKIECSHWVSRCDCLQAQKQVQEDWPFQLGYHLGVTRMTRIVPLTNWQELEQGKTWSYQFKVSRCCNDGTSAKVRKLHLAYYWANNHPVLQWWDFSQTRISHVWLNVPKLHPANSWANNHPVLQWWDFSQTRISHVWLNVPNCTRPILELTTTRCCNDGASARPVSHTFGWTFQKLHPANAWVPRFVSHRFGTTFENSSMKLQGPTIHSKPLTNQIRKKSNFFREEYDKIDTDKQTILCLHIKGQKWSDKP